MRRRVALALTMAVALLCPAGWQQAQAAVPVAAPADQPANATSSARDMLAQQATTLEAPAATADDGGLPPACQFDEHNWYSPSRFSSCYRFSETMKVLELNTGRVSGSLLLSVYQWWEMSPTSLQITHNIRIKATDFDGDLEAGMFLVIESICDQCRITGGEANFSIVQPVSWYSHTWVETITGLSTSVRATSSSLQHERMHWTYVAHKPGLIPVPKPEIYVPFDAWRCDNDIPGVDAPGCVSPTFYPTIYYDTTQNPLVEPVADHVQDAQAAGHPGAEGSGRPLHRVFSDAAEKANRAAACRNFVPEGYFDSCDEYPLATTREGGAGSSIRAVPKRSNDSQGGLTGAGYAFFRIYDHDAFYVKAIVLPTGNNKIMAVGDSISQGLEGDYTWRYRLYQHLANAAEDISWVGPWTGTTRVPESLPYGWPEVGSPPVHNGRYNPEIHFPSANYAQWGWQMHQAKDTIGQVVGAKQPDYLLLELGFNDLAWGVSSPDGLLNDLRTFLANARSAKSDVRVVVANVVHREPLPQLPNLPQIISSYNTKLANAISSLSTPTSKVVLADIDGPLAYATDTYDGLHPNSLGEYKIARSFGNALSSQFGLGPQFGNIPVNAVQFVMGAPQSLTATATDNGINLRWNHVFGASGYWIYQRDVTAGADFTRSRLPVPADSWDVGWLIDGHTYEFKVKSARGYAESGLSAPASATVHLRTAAPPTINSALPESNSVALDWNSPTGPYSDTVRGFKVYWSDTSVPDDFHVMDSSGTFARIPNLVPHHLYSIAISSVNIAGEGTPTGVPAVIPGHGAPPAPVLNSATIVGATDVQLRWTGSPSAANYWIWQRNSDTAQYGQLPWPVTGATTFTAGWLFGPENYSFCVHASNGTLVSAKSNCRKAQLGAAIAGAASLDRPAPSSALPQIPPVDQKLLENIRSQQLRD